MINNIYVDYSRAFKTYTITYDFFGKKNKISNVGVLEKDEIINRLLKMQHSHIKKQIPKMSYIQRKRLEKKQ